MPFAHLQIAEKRSEKEGNGPNEEKKISSIELFKESEYAPGKEKNGKEEKLLERDCLRLCRAESNDDCINEKEEEPPRSFF